MNKRDKRITSYFIMFSLIIIIGVAFAILQANLQINGTAKITQNTWDVHFDNVVVNPESVAIGTGNTAATIDPNNTLKVDFSVTLSLPGDFYEFTVDVENEGTIDAMIGTLTKSLKVNNVETETVPDYLIYTVTYDDGGEILENHLLEAGDTLTYLVRLEYNRDIDEIPIGAQTIVTSLEPNYIQADNGAVDRPIAMLIDGQSFNARIKQLSGTSDATYESSNANITAFQKSSTAPDMNSMTSDNNVSVSEERPIYVWFDNGTIYYYSDSSKTYLNSNASYMFSSFNSLTSLDLSDFDTSKVTTMNYIFSDCSSLVEIDVSSFDTSNVSNMQAMFLGCSNLEDLNLDNFDLLKISSINNLSGMFAGSSSIKRISMKNWKIPSTFEYVIGCSNLAICSNNLEYVDVTDWDLSNAIDMTGLFYNYKGNEIIGLDTWDTSNITDMSNMFMGCSNLETLDLSTFNTSKVRTMEAMFSNCSSLEELNIDNFDLTVSDSSIYCYATAGIFNNATYLQRISMKNWKLPSTFTNFIGCSNLNATNIEYINVDNWNLSNTTNISGLFGGYKGKEIRGLNTWNTSNITNMSSMFKDNSNITELILSSFNTNVVTNMSQMFQNSPELKTIKVGNSFNTTSVTSSTNMFSGCTSLIGGNGTTYNSSFIDKTYARIDESGTSGYFTRSY